MYKMVVKLKKAMNVKFEEKFGTGDPDQINICMVACGVDPRYKNLKSLPSCIREKVKDNIIVRVKSFIALEKLAAAPLPKKRKLCFSSESSSDDDDQTLQQTTSHYAAVQEYEAFMREDKCERCDNCPCDKCALEWWKTYGPRYPNVCKVAQDLLAVPATSTSSERCFSTAGHVANRLRSALSPQHVDALVFLSKNKDMC